MKVVELIETLQKLPLDAPVFFTGGFLPEVNYINPNGPNCVVWIDKFGSNVLAQIANEPTEED